MKQAKILKDLIEKMPTVIESAEQEIKNLIKQLPEDQRDIIRDARRELKKAASSSDAISFLEVHKKMMRKASKVEKLNRTEEKVDKKTIRKARE